MKAFINIFFISLILFNCNINKNVSVFYENKSNETEKNIKLEKWYYENTSKKYIRKKMRF